MNVSLTLKLEELFPAKVADGDKSLGWLANDIVGERPHAEI